MPEVLRCDPELLDKDLTGKVVIVTGAMAGIGLVTATQLIKQKATVILAGRNATQGQTVASEVGGVFMHLDLASLQSVRDFVEAFLTKYNRLDVLVNNAGVLTPPFGRTQDGFELTMGTNHFGHFLLTELLRDILEKSTPSRIIVVSSCTSADCTHGFSAPTMDFSDLHWQSREYNPKMCYSQSKLANVLHAMEIAKRYKGVTAYSLHPGSVTTDIVRHILPCCCKPCQPCILWGERRKGNMIDTWDGVQTSLHCILSEPADLENGAFYSQIGTYTDPKIAKGGWPLTPHPNPEVTEANAERLWEVSIGLVGLGSIAAGVPRPEDLKAPLMQGMEMEMQGR